MSHREDKYGFKIFRDLIAAGFDVQGVSVRGAPVLERTIYKALKDLPQKPDVVVTVVPHEITEQVVDDCYTMGIREIWMQPGSESQAAIEMAEKYGITATHNACFMARYGIW